MNKKFLVANKYESRLISIDSVLYFETFNGRLTIHYYDNGQHVRFEFKGVMKDIESHMSACGIVRIHRCYTISVGHVASVNGKYVTLDDPQATKIPIGRSFAERLKESLFSSCLAVIG